MCDNQPPTPERPPAGAAGAREHALLLPQFRQLTRRCAWVAFPSTHRLVPWISRASDPPDLAALLRESPMDRLEVTPMFLGLALPLERAAAFLDRAPIPAGVVQLGPILHAGQDRSHCISSGLVV